MSYLNQDLDFEPSRKKIIEGIDEFDKVVTERINSDEYSINHKSDILELSNKLRKIKIEILKTV